MVFFRHPILMQIARQVVLLNTCMAFFVWRWRLQWTQKDLLQQFLPLSILRHDVFLCCNVTFGIRDSVRFFCASKETMTVGKLWSQSDINGCKKVLGLFRDMDLLMCLDEGVGSRIRILAKLKLYKKPLIVFDEVQVVEGRIIFEWKSCQNEV